MKKLKTGLIKIAILLVLTTIVFCSCGGPRYGCPISASHSFGPGR